MARSQARIHTSVWRNADFVKLTASAQATYWMVLSQPDVNMAGVVAYMPERWSQFRTDGDIHADLAELEDAGFLVVDAGTREVWIRSFIKHDGVIAGPKTRAAMWSAWSGIFSTTIRARFVALLDGLSQAPSDGASDGVSSYPAEAASKGWISPDDLAAARQNAPSDTPSQAPQEALSDGVSPRARADSASTSTSVSTSGDARTRDPQPPPPDDQNHPPAPTSWDQAWNRITTYLRRYGAHDPDRPSLDDQLDPTSRDALRKIGGPTRVRQDTDPKGAKFAFRDAYQDLAKESARA